MKLVTSLLLGSAAALATVAGAQAADLPFRKAAPVDYVRVCDWVGLAGYFYIPGTDTCIRIGGEMRAEYNYVTQSKSFNPTPGTAIAGFPATGVFTPAKARNGTGFFARGKIEVDARTQTAYGLLRAFVRYQSDNQSGGYAGILTNGGSVNTTYIDKAYITFAGFTAGRIQSFFDLYADDWNFEDIANSDQSTQVLAYTATFGGGFSATISAEDPAVRRDGIGTITFGPNAIGPNAAFAPVANGLTAAYAAQRYPDAVAQLAYTQAWGTLQLSAAFHDVNTVTTAATVPGGTVFPSSSKAGFAIQGGVDIKLPMLAAGDEFFLEGAYQEGAYKYQDSNGTISQFLPGFQHNDVDAVAVGNGAGGYTLALSRGFSVMGAFQHYFTPQFHDVLFGSYEEVGYGVAKNTDWRAGGLGDAQQYKIGNDFVFTPVHNLDIGVEVLYAKVTQTLAHAPGAAGAAAANAAFALAAPGVKKDPDAFEVRLRLDRNF